jgi:hypothetical protein
VDESELSYEHPLLGTMLRTPGLSLAATSLDRRSSGSAAARPL